MNPQMYATLGFVAADPLEMRLRNEPSTARQLPALTGSESDATLRLRHVKHGSYCTGTHLEAKHGPAASLVSVAMRDNDAKIGPYRAGPGYDRAAKESGRPILSRAWKCRQ